MRKSCGPDLVERVAQICQSRGGHMTHTSPRLHRRVRRGIVNECCVNKCADHHIYPYCSNDGGLKSSETDAVSSSIETPFDLEVGDSPAPIAQALVRSFDTGDAMETQVDGTTAIPVEVTTDFTSERTTKNLPFQVGTVPPEYRMSPFVLLYNNRFPN